MVIRRFMKRIAAITIALALPAILCAQNYEAPDNDKILAGTLNAASPFYYPALMSRYMDGGQGLSAEDYRYLYYGYAYSDDYKPLDPVPGADEILMILEKSNVPDSSQCRRILECGRLAMRRDPFSPSTLNIMAYACALLGDTLQARSFNARRLAVINTIKCSGSGVKESSPWAILSFSHAEDVLVSMGLSASGRRVVSRTAEYIETGKSKDKIKGYFFDFSRIYWIKPETTPEKRPAGFEVNGVKVK